LASGITPVAISTEKCEKGKENGHVNTSGYIRFILTWYTFTLCAVLIVLVQSKMPVVHVLEVVTTYSGNLSKKKMIQKCLQIILPTSNPL